ncbi:MAG: DUF285 domain-containing protein [Paludibacteraceae bacterium]|nr:DUF285 domain-containing protein [Paludibacteraceae bacterium]
MEYKYRPKTKKTLLKAIDKEIKLQGDTADLNCIDTSAITDMSLLFYDTKFNGDISQWDVSNVTNMWLMFFKSQFNGNISQWDVSNVSNMGYMFAESKFNGNISKWNVSKVTNMFCMFSSSQFNGDISNWDVSKVRWLKDIFLDSKFEGDISNWNIDNVTDDRSSVLEYGIFRDYSDSGENSDETGLAYSGKGESSLVCYENSKPREIDGEADTIFDRLKNAFGKIFG